MQKSKIYIAYILLISINTYASDVRKGVITCPVEDMFTNYSHHNNLPASPDQYGCGRAHQGLFNEECDILEEDKEKHALKIAFKKIKYSIDKNPNIFWVSDKNIIPLDEIKNKEIIQTIPDSEYGKRNTIVITYPWQDSSGTKYSVGTRFKHKPELDHDNYYTIEKADFKNNKIIYDRIPHENAIKEIKTNADEHRKLFIKNINQLINRVNQTNMVIAYIYGGSSFIHSHESNDYYKENGRWYRNNKQENSYTGYDCSEFIMRMAQIAGIDFPWKTTWAIQANKKALTDNDSLENGDIIWIKGHVMIVNDIEKNELIHARGYTSGYGSIHRVPLSEIFEDVITYDDLLQRYKNKQNLTLKDKQGNNSTIADTFLLLKLID